MPPTGPETHGLREDSIFIRRFEVAVVDGPDRGARAVSSDDELTIGTAAGCHLQVTDPAVSRHHCAVRVTARGLELRDHGSTNGTMLGDHEIVRGYIRSGARLRLGATTVVVTILADEIAQPLASGSTFGDLVGASPAMRRLYPMLERGAQSDVTVLIEGETGTGKELVAEAIHLASARRGKPFVVVDCGALPRQLTESELFGHVRGAFTGAEADRVGAFEQAQGGTIFLDEIGELALDLQPLLLRALENHTIRRVGTNDQREVDVRVVAASHRDLRALVNEKRFRADLYYRLNVLRVVVPPLRDREGDIRLLATHFWQMFRPDKAAPEDLLLELEAQTWPGNVRELRNMIERAALIGHTRTALDGEDLPYGEAKERMIADWERRWLTRLLQTHDHNLSRAARAAQMGRSYLRQLVRRYDLSRGDDGE
ncbi:MAG TPA: sigma 54-interacting transcriptional regulator [Kofleriaceae bacterium]|nr:sigma 54-interacting transcriptional regulator [Kofleriaceae bacterium]